MKLSVAVQEFDDQHKKLIDLVNELDDAMRAGKSKDVLEKTLKGLISYTASHFAAEEKKMTAHKYPAYAAHKAEHEKLVAKVLQYQNDLLTGKVAISVELMQFLKDWVTQHIMNTDKKYSAFFNAQGIK